MTHMNTASCSTATPRKESPLNHRLRKVTMSAQSQFRYLHILVRRFARGFEARLNVVKTRRALRAGRPHNAILHAVDLYNAHHTFAEVRRLLAAVSFGCAIATLGSPTMYIFASLGAAILYSLRVIRRPVDLAHGRLTQLVPDQLLLLLVQEKRLDANTRSELSAVGEVYGGLPLWALVEQAVRLERSRRARGSGLQPLTQEREKPREAAAERGEPATTIDLHGMLARQRAQTREERAVEQDPATSPKPQSPEGERS